MPGAWLGQGQPPKGREKERWDKRVRKRQKKEEWAEEERVAHVSGPREGVRTLSDSSPAQEWGVRSSIKYKERDLLGVMGHRKAIARFVTVTIPQALRYGHEPQHCSHS